ncbi:MULTISPECIES: endonuclease/exonuclease/phosphatase family protein [unclassified Lysobacter]|uniref:endonuclease/exonuclease/phosphatase family protein n=1 Tax=unclassified Lysobacter TaxID=2635362 RepID=UPI001BE9DE39|nr:MULTISPECIES: endonuclease/exonuclease/phosphatase family protein [unclassified Lysobacter]MBT2748890.1 endonuclease/exonuclease/phosphatase family protein [Lysobacter sp. ISL-42]MBT2753082.1 endonuclease/exonuclease/phosphatase family protein [Lysobacter sp. ISL-50]MBT2777251.1 endonuclease/exonuclease/phosphatase family protein [Lysobacter sp. ISL-54]MBT2783231.1 endonuclease/exonuclease/phosphatase family protein [Lysobacter sp. ISL-52]
MIRNPFIADTAPRRRRSAIPAAIALFAAMLATTASGEELPRSQDTIAAAPVAVLTLNLWHDKGDWPKRRAMIVDEIRRLNPNLIALQEVLQRPGLRNQAEDLAQATGYQVRFVSVDADDAERRYGNAILYKTLGSAQDMRKLEPLNDYRTAAHATLDAMHKGVDFYATHLHNEREGGAIRRRQIASLLDFIDDSQRTGNVIVAGDFNSDADSPELKALAARYRDAYAQAHPDSAADPARSTTLNPAYLPAQRIDHVFYDPKRFELIEARIVLNQPRDGVWASDHFGLFVRLRPIQPPESGRRH